MRLNRIRKSTPHILTDAIIIIIIIHYAICPLKMDSEAVGEVSGQLRFFEIISFQFGFKRY